MLSRDSWLITKTVVYLVIRYKHQALLGASSTTIPELLQLHPEFQNLRNVGSAQIAVIRLSSSLEQLSNQMLCSFLGMPNLT